MQRVIRQIKILVTLFYQCIYATIFRNHIIGVTEEIYARIASYSVCIGSTNDNFGQIRTDNYIISCPSQKSDII